jgi:hypothetical protein
VRVMCYINESIKKTVWWLELYFIGAEGAHTIVLYTLTNKS